MIARKLHPNEWQVIAENHHERDSLNWLFERLVRGTMPKWMRVSFGVDEPDGEGGANTSEG